MVVALDFDVLSAFSKVFYMQDLMTVVAVVQVLLFKDFRAVRR